MASTRAFQWTLFAAICLRLSAMSHVVLFRDRSWVVVRHQVILGRLTLLVPCGQSYVLFLSKRVPNKFPFLSLYLLLN